MIFKDKSSHHPTDKALYFLVPLTKEGALELVDPPDACTDKPVKSIKLNPERDKCGLWCKPLKPVCKAVREQKGLVHGSIIYIASREEYKEYLEKVPYLENGVKKWKETDLAFAACLTCVWEGRTDKLPWRYDATWAYRCAPKSNVGLEMIQKHETKIHTSRTNNGTGRSPAYHLLPAMPRVATRGREFCRRRAPALAYTFREMVCRVWRVCWPGVSL